ncbi:MAG TPA: histidine--tRNA ligase, partial [Clostridium sp.]|nr:histidine--tRNA ligase [Clostridium sp.]
FAKKMKYANKLAIPYVIIIGEDEKATNKVLLKNMESGDQQLISVEEVISILNIK